MQTLDAIRIQMREAEPVLKALDHELEKISFDPRKRESIDAAIEHVVLAIDARLKRFESNPILGPMAEDLKAQYVEGIHAQVADSALKRA
ncbi:hypothetical protein SAMN05216593_101628 [Pseudomonas asturiensis]|uniref:Uncharacterized protein n=1 Tax=Pseudomonas asturiensis TaxID=1190415 RepID=A0A1M7JYM5_9PSED|nr:hypothetical protein [Pseudomonas asturiensis]SHM58126.1 hypothetical protein SAMN05216593_101628 [Pseudomonas asturiensis]